MGTRYRKAEAALAATAAALVGQGAAQAVGGPLDSPDKAELAAWSALFWQYADTGTAGTGASAFYFTDANLNSPLFSPWRASLRKIQAAKGVDVNTMESCWGATGSVALSDIKSFMIDGKISTPYDHTAEIAAHLAALLEALGEGQEVAVTFEQDKLVTVGLDPKTLTLVPIDNAPVPANEVVAALLNATASAAQQIAAGQNLSGVVHDSLVGNPPYWVNFFGLLEGSLGNAGAAAGARVRLLDASFGEYGSLILAKVDTNQGVYLLVDTVNGTVAGPYDDANAYDARALLATHPEYVEGQTIEYYSSGDCAKTSPTAGTWNPVPPTFPTTIRPALPTPIVACPPGWCPPPTPPGGCPGAPIPIPGTWYPSLPCYNPTASGWLNCNCGISPLGSTFCVEVTQEVGGTPPAIIHVVRLYNCGLVTPNSCGCPIGIAGSCTCALKDTQYWY